MTTELNAIHGDQYSYPQYKLWARLITCGQHAYKENAPNVPMITGSYSKERKQKDSSSNLGDVIAGAAVAIIEGITREKCSLRWYSSCSVTWQKSCTKRTVLKAARGYSEAER